MTSKAVVVCGARGREQRSPCVKVVVGLQDEVRRQRVKHGPEVHPRLRRTYTAGSAPQRAQPGAAFLPRHRKPAEGCTQTAFSDYSTQMLASAPSTARECASCCRALSGPTRARAERVMRGSSRRSPHLYGQVLVRFVDGQAQYVARLGLLRIHRLLQLRVPRPVPQHKPYADALRLLQPVKIP